MPQPSSLELFEEYKNVDVILLPHIPPDGPEVSRVSGVGCRVSDFGLRVKVMTQGAVAGRCRTQEQVERRYVAASRGGRGRA